MLQVSIYLEVKYVSSPHLGSHDAGHHLLDGLAVCVDQPKRREVGATVLMIKFITIL